MSSKKGTHAALAMAILLKACGTELFRCLFDWESEASTELNETTQDEMAETLTPISNNWVALAGTVDLLLILYCSAAQRRLEGARKRPFRKHSQVW